jgi:plastocyanin
LVHRQLARAAALALLLLASAMVLPSLAAASNSRVSISNYQWSTPEVDLDLGEHATWYWTGPDTMHSVTGTSANSLQWDSDPGNQPFHNIGDDYQITFSQPGIYHFQCKLHSLVAGTVVVSNTPGDPTSEPDPIPKSNVDTHAPTMRTVRLGAYKFGPRGAPLQYSLSERGKLDIEYYRYSGFGKNKGKASFAGYATAKSYVGYNRVRLGSRKPHFKPKPGLYRVDLRVSDSSNNISKVKHRQFRIW